MLPSLTRRMPVSPFDALWDMQRTVDRLFNGSTTDTWTLPSEVIETDNEMKFVVDMPGLRPEEIEVTVENNVLSISGERKWEREEGKPEGEYHVFERRYGKFQRSFALPRRVDSNKIQADYQHGVLTILLPKLEEAKPRRIQINAGEARQIEAK